MALETQETITREEFDRRLDAFNEKCHMELQQIEAKQTQVEALLTHYEYTLDEIEGKLATESEPLSQVLLLRKRLQELAIRTADVAASL